MLFVGLKIVLLLFAFNMHSVVTQSTAASNATSNATTNTNTTVGPAKFDDVTKLSYDIYCKFQANAHRCVVRTQRRFYFDLQLHNCVRFEYASCEHSYNMFTGRHECLSACQDVAYSKPPENATANIYCRFQPEFGDCNSYHPMWYFDIAEMRCRGFSFSGCGGNHNRFHTSTDCLSTCGAVILKH